MDTEAVVNTVLLLVVLPVLGYLATAINRSNKTYATQQGEIKGLIAENTAAFRELKTVIVGYEQQGGLQRRVQELANRMHRAEQALTPLLLDKGLSLEANFHLRKAE